MAEFIITAFNIFLLAFLVGYFGSGFIEGFFGKRKVNIAQSIDSAKKEKLDAAALRADYEQRIRDFEAERARILKDAGERARIRENEVIDDAKTEAERILLRARREAELKKSKLNDEIKCDIVNYASAAAAKIIRENIDDDLQARLIEDTLNGMGATTWQG